MVNALDVYCVSTGAFWMFWGIALWFLGFNTWLGPNSIFMPYWTIQGDDMLEIFARWLGFAIVNIPMMLPVGMPKMAWTRLSVIGNLGALVICVYGSFLPEAVPTSFKLLFAEFTAFLAFGIYVMYKGSQDKFLHKVEFTPLDVLNVFCGCWCFFGLMFGLGLFCCGFNNFVGPNSLLISYWTKEANNTLDFYARFLGFVCLLYILALPLGMPKLAWAKLSLFSLVGNMGFCACAASLPEAVVGAFNVLMAEYMLLLLLAVYAVCKQPSNSGEGYTLLIQTN